MKLRFVGLVLVLILLVASGLVAYAWTNQPKLLNIYPPDGAINIPVTAQIRMEFSRAMNSESVIDRLKIEPAMDGSFSWDENILTFTPDQVWPGGQEISLILEAEAKATGWLAFPMDAGTWSFTTNAASLAYLWPSEGKADIYALNPATGEVYQYTYGMGVLEYTASSDGMTLYFSVNNAKGGSDIFLIDRMDVAGVADNSIKPRRILDCGVAQCRSPETSLDRRYLAYEYLTPDPGGSLGPAQIWILDLTTRDAFPVGQVDHETVQPAWSSTGWLAYYDRTTRVYEVVQPLTNGRIQLSNQTGQPGAWSVDGEFYLAPEIYYFRATDISETGTSHLLRYRLSTGGSDDVSGAEAVEDVEGNYSPNGQSIAFARKFLSARRWSFGRQLWIMDADGSNPHAITDEADYNHYDLAWSRDGLMLAYVRFNQAKLSDPPELWMINTDGSDPVQLVIGGYSPLWIP